MTQFIVSSGGVECPACGLQLTKQREYDRRVAIMKHESTPICSMHDRLFRVDRLNGNAEEYHEA